MNDQESHSSSPDSSSESGSSAARKLRWTALIVLTCINLLNYIDRYIFSALLPAIKSDLHFTDTELGILGSAFLLAYIFASPIFGSMGDHGRRSRIMSLGVGVWSVATAFSGVCTSFIGQFVTRASVGLGESAYSVIAPSTIADHFSKKSRGKVFAIYSGAIPVGSALGYVMGGWLEPRVGWQKSFFVVGVPGLILACLLFFMHDPKRGSADDELGLAHQPAKGQLQVYKALFKNGGFLTTVLGYAAYTFVVGGMAFWMPSYLVRYFEVSLEKANIQFGALTVAGGFIGTMLGGMWSDHMEKKSGNGFLKVSVIAMIIATPLFFYALSLHDYKDFMIALFFLEVALFLPISPLDAATISYVRPAWRSTAMALNIFMIHVLGDGISRTLMGIVSDKSGLRTAIEILPLVLIVAAVIWLVGFIVYWQPVAWPHDGLVLPTHQAHRGYRPKDEGIVENTIGAFRRAREAGAQMVECDVQLTSDGKAVLFHDDDLKRLANRPDLVANTTLANMKEWAGAPLLQELLTDPQCPPMVNVELKSSAFRNNGLERAALDAVIASGAQSRVLFSSFNPFALRRMAKLAPDIPRALLVTEENDPSNKMYLRRMLLGFYCRAHMINVDKDMVSVERLDRWAERGLRVAAWTVNDPAQARKFLDGGVVSVISDCVFG